MATGAGRGSGGLRSYARRVGPRLGGVKPGGSVWPEPWRPSLGNRLRGRERPPIQPMSRDEFASLRGRYEYYKNRAPYMSAAARIVAGLIVWRVFSLLVPILLGVVAITWWRRTTHGAEEPSAWSVANDQHAGETPRPLPPTTSPPD